MPSMTSCVKGVSILISNHINMYGCGGFIFNLNLQFSTHICGKPNSRSNNSDIWAADLTMALN